MNRLFARIALFSLLARLAITTKCQGQSNRSFVSAARTWLCPLVPACEQQSDLSQLLMRQCVDDFL